ncbi:hypothetical protein H4582DRAFT_103830 [Lactarius indigo]|nr:hypothetical protein H4582DRAFT_103830 [Lactarius indigo]
MFTLFPLLSSCTSLLWHRSFASVLPYPIVPALLMQSSNNKQPALFCFHFFFSFFLYPCPVLTCTDRVVFVLPTSSPHPVCAFIVPSGGGARINVIIR